MRALAFPLKITNGDGSLYQPAYRAAAAEIAPAATATGAVLSPSEAAAFADSSAAKPLTGIQRQRSMI